MASTTGSTDTANPLAVKPESSAVIINQVDCESDACCWAIVGKFLAEIVADVVCIICAIEQSGIEAGGGEC